MATGRRSRGPANRRTARPSGPNGGGPDLFGELSQPDDTSPYDDPEPDDGDAEALRLMRDANAALDADHPLEFLALGSSLAAALTRTDPEFELAGASGGRSGVPGLPELPTASDLISIFIQAGERPTQALGYLLPRFSGNDLDRIRVDRELGDAVTKLPRWLQSLDRADVVGALMAMDPVRAGANLAIGVRLRSGHHLTMIGFVDFDLGSVLTDAFAMPGSLQTYVTQWRQAGGRAVVEQQPISLADARARFEAAIAIGDMTIPPYESDSWPASRPLLEWVLGKLPEGGSDFDDRLPTDTQCDELIEDFLRSPHGRQWRSDHDVRSIIDSFFWFRGSHCDPLLWSPKAVGIFLSEFVPDKVIAPEDYLSKYPDLLRSFIRYGHEKRAVPQACTADALETLMDEEGAFLARATGAFDAGNSDGFVVELPGWLGLGIHHESLIAQFAEDNRMRMALRVGGEDVLEALDDKPLPVDEPMDFDQVDPDIVAAVAEVQQLADEACAVLFEPEARTVARRILHDVAAKAPEIFCGQGLTTTAAAAICWITMINNIGWDGTWVPVKDLMAYFGRKGSPSSRAAPMLEALGVPASSRFDLGDVRYLTASTRTAIISSRDQFDD